ncbi:MAG TPA: YceI family protein, partial [Candidatus Limnocylindrales bacterium]
MAGPDVWPSETIRAALASARVIVAATDDGSDESYRRSRETAVRLAKALGTELVLCDQSWSGLKTVPDLSAVDDAGRGLLDAAGLAALGRSSLAAQVRDAVDQGVTARGWLAFDAGRRRLDDCLEQVSADAVVVPEGVIRSSASHARWRASAASHPRMALTLLADATGRLHTADDWQVDPDTVLVAFVARQFRFLGVRGRFLRVELDLDFDAEQPLNSRVTARIRAASLTTGIGLRDRQLRSPLFLNAERFPYILFTSRLIYPMDPEARRYAISGNLTLREISRP